MTIAGWYVLYRDRHGHRVRATSGFDAAISTARQLCRQGRDVVQLGPQDKTRAAEILDKSEIHRICAAT